MSTIVQWRGVTHPCLHTVMSHGRALLTQGSQPHSARFARHAREQLVTDIWNAGFPYSRLVVTTLGPPILRKTKENSRLIHPASMH
jgi:hypothetical protein